MPAVNQPPPLPQQEDDARGARRRRRAEGRGDGPPAVLAPAAAARDATLEADAPTQCDMIPCDIPALLKHMAADPRPVFLVKTHENIDVAVEFDYQVAGDLVKRELQELSATSDKLFAEYCRRDAAAHRVPRERAAASGAREAEVGSVKAGVARGLGAARNPAELSGSSRDVRPHEGRG